jgi:hypothetical protein
MPRRHQRTDGGGASAPRCMAVLGRFRVERRANGEALSVMTRSLWPRRLGGVLELGALRGRRSCVGLGREDLAARGCGRVGADGQVACVACVGSEIRPDVAAEHRLVAGLGCWRGSGRWVAAVLDLAAVYVQHPGGTLRPGQLAAAVEPGRLDAPAPSRSALHGCTPAPRPPPGRPRLSGRPDVLHVLGCPARRVALGWPIGSRAGQQ